MQVMLLIAITFLVIIIAILLSRGRVYRISPNTYRYVEAIDACHKKYRGRLATVDEVKSAYNYGADWCGIGWADGMNGIYASQADRHESGCQKGVHYRRLPGQLKLGAYCWS